MIKDKQANNLTYRSYAIFCQLCKGAPFKVMRMLQDRSQPQTINSNFITQCKKQLVSNFHSAILFSFLMPIAFTYLGTIILHRRRSFALTSPSGLRSLIFKYLPVITLFGSYGIFKAATIDVSLVREDYGEIDEQFSKIFAQYGPLYFKEKTKINLI